MSIKENLSQYLDSFIYTNDKTNRADVSTFVYDFLDIIFKSYNKTEIYVLKKKQIYEKYNTIIEKIDIFNNSKNKNKIVNLLFVLIQNSIFGDFGLTKTKLRKIMEMGNTKVTEYLGELRKYNLYTEILNGKNHYYKANLEELDKYDI